MTKIIVILGFVVSFGAGMVVGIGTQRAASAPPTTQRSRGPGGWLSEALKLTPDQQQKMNKIWSETARRGGREQEDRRRQLRREREEAIAALIRPEDKPRHDQALKHYQDQIDAIDQEWRKAFEEAHKQTLEILTPDQRVKYEEIRKQRQDRGPRDGASRGDGPPRGGPPHGRDGREFPRPAGDDATSRPAR